MRKILFFVVLFFCNFLSTTIFAASLSIYEKPEPSSKIVSLVKNGDQLMPIFYTDNKEWVKIANLKNGDVGWMRANELKGPMIITKINGSKIQQQIVVNKDGKNKEPIAYSVTQYSGSNELKPEDAEKVIKAVEKRNEKIKAYVQQMQKDMFKSMHEMFKDFDKNFGDFPVIQPIVVTTDDSQSKNKDSK